MEKSDFKKVNKFLKQLNSTEYLYLKHTMDIVDMINKLIQKYKFSKESFLKYFKINEFDYSHFILGDWNYRLSDVSTLQFLLRYFERRNFEIEIAKQEKNDEKLKKCTECNNPNLNCCQC